MSESNAKTKELNNLMMGVQNELYPRAVERREVAMDSAIDFINQMTDEGVIDIKCEECGKKGAVKEVDGEDDSEDDSEDDCGDDCEDDKE